MKRTCNLLSIMLLLAFSLWSCKNQGSKDDLSTPEYNAMISAFTSGIISSESSVKIRFAEPIKDSVTVNSMVEKGVFEIDPPVDGALYYVDRQTIEFRPETRFKPGTAYDVKVKLKKLFKEYADAENFEFRFHTIDQHLEVDFGGFRPYNDYKPELNYLSGSLITADVADPQAIESVIKVLQNKSPKPVRWTHSNNGKQHDFIIDSINRAEQELIVKVNYDGSPINSKQKGSKEFVVPALGDFKVIGQQLIQYPEQHVIINFSDPIRKDQYLDGLIRLSNGTDMRFMVEGNTIKAYPNVRQNGTLRLMVEPGIRNTAGKGLKAAQQLEITFEEIKPAIQLLGDGVIIPAADEIILPFKAVNIKALDVSIIRIYEDNIAQFLQVNQLDGNRELKRAGRLIAKKTIDLVADQPINYGQWNTFSLDLTDLVKTEPGAIYRVELNFRQSQSMFPCESVVDNETQQETENYDGLDEEEMTYWDSYESYYSSWDYYNYDGYSWEDRENPCKPAYYGKRRAVARNVLASNLGLTAKYGNSKKMNVVITNLLNAESIANSKVRVYNFQQQVIAEGTTDGDGMIAFKLQSRPFLIIAEHQGQKGYLRLVDGAALSYSMFDVSGTVVEKNIKGFIYAERGVWRPGDSIFLNLIVDDHRNPLPDGHPVTFELKNPQGKVVQKNVVPGNANRFYPFHTKTAPDAPTGRYTVSASIGGLSFSKVLQVETIKPNRLRIDLDFTADTIYPSRGTIAGILEGEWLTGATARGLKAEIEVLFRSTTTSFKGFENYTFHNPAKKVDNNGSVFWSGNLNDQGTARFSKDLNISGEAPGMLNAIFTTRLFENSGEFSIDQKTVVCAPYNTYVGIKTPPGDKRGMLLTDTSHTVDVVTLTPEGEPITKIGLDVKVYKLSWRWWWDASYENLASYMGNTYQSPVYQTTITTKRGKGSFDFRIDYPEWGRYLIVVKDQGGHSAAKVVYLDWPGWAGRAGKGDPDAASVLSFSADKAKYNVGETALLTIPTSPKGRLLISLENGSEVMRQEWISATGQETKYNLKITPEMAPNIYVCATLIQPHANTGNDLPIRMFGVIPISVEDPETRLHPELSMPDELSPESTVTLEVSERDNKNMTYTIAMVDEGLLDLTRFRTPDPWNLFYAKQALGVKTWDMFEHVLGAFGGRIDGIYSIGGGMDETGEGAKDANRFPPMVKFIGPFQLNGKSNSHTIEIPNYIGSLRTMVIAGQNGAFGHTEKTTPVKQPLMLLATLPRVLGPGENVAMPVNVFVMDHKIRNVKLSVSSNDMFVVKDPQKQVSFDGTGDKIVDFDLIIPEKTGVGKIKITATAGKEKAEYEISLDIRSPNPPVTNYVTSVVEPSESIEKDIQYVGMPGTNDLLLEVSNIPPVDFGRRLKYLLRYPHGCIEQTTSAAFPQLFLADVVDVNEKVRQKTESNIKAAISRLSSFQLSGGGFSYWPGSIRESDWGTSYAGHFLIEAREKGYDVPQAVLRSWERYQSKTARRWSVSGSTNAYEIKQEQLMQAYRLFTLALSGNAEMGAMNRLRERTDLEPEAKWRLAAAYALAGQKETGRELITNVTTTVDDYYDSRYSFGSSTRDKAMMLESMIILGMKENGAILLEDIAKRLSSQHWMSTQTTAYALLSVAKYTGGNAIGEQLEFEYTFNGGETMSAASGLSLVQLNFDTGTSQTGNIKIKNNSGGIIFARIVNTGLPLPGKEVAKSNNLQVSVDYYDLEGKTVNPSSLDQGTDFRAVYRIYNPGTMGYLENVALTTIFPPGWEIHNERLFQTENNTNNFTYQDIRDDRVMTYFSLPTNQAKTISIRLNAAYRGKYYLPAVKAEEMYKNDVQVIIPGQWVMVRER